MNRVIRVLLAVGMVSGWAGASYQDLVKRHLMQIKKFPHAPVGKGRPYSGIENLRPESKKMVEAFMRWSHQE